MLNIKNINKEFNLNIIEFNKDYWIKTQEVVEFCKISYVTLRKNSDEKWYNVFSGDDLEQLKSKYGEQLSIESNTPQLAFFNINVFSSLTKKYRERENVKKLLAKLKEFQTDATKQNTIETINKTVNTDIQIEALNKSNRNTKILFTIKKLGAIQTENTIEFKPFMVLSGESGVGKSYTAFVLHFLNFMFQIDREEFSVLEVIKSIVDLHDIKQQVANSNEATFKIPVNKIENYFQQNINNYLEYILNNPEIDSDVEIKFQNINELEYKLSGNGDTFSENNFAKQLWKNIANQLIGKNLKTLLLPPGRGVVIEMKFSAIKYLHAGMYMEFIRDKDNISTKPLKLNKQNDELLEKILRQLFKGEIKVEGDKFTYKFENTEIPLSAAASSIKEIAPLFLLMKNTDYRNVSVLLEEPEAHLHPSLIRKTALLIAFLINKGAYVQITTHSSYFLNQINNLIKLSYIKQKDIQKYSKVTEKVDIDEHLLISPDLVGAYHFERQNGDVKIKYQDISKEAIPFDTFEKTVNEMFEETDEINDAFYA